MQQTEGKQCSRLERKHSKRLEENLGVNVGSTMKPWEAHCRKELSRCQQLPQVL